MPGARTRTAGDRFPPLWTRQLATRARLAGRQVIAAREAKGPYRWAVARTVVFRARPVTVTRSRIGSPGATRCREVSVWRLGELGVAPPTVTESLLFAGFGS